MLHILFGCASTQGSFDHDLYKYQALELDIFDQPNVPKSGTLRKWRTQVGPSLCIALVAPQTVSQVRPGPAFDEALTQLLTAQRELEAQVLLLRTPVEVTPALLQRERLANVVQRIREGLGDAQKVVRIVWESSGLWELREAAKFARELNIELCADPFNEFPHPFADVSLRYIPVRSIGGRTTLPPSRMRMIAEWLIEQSHAEESMRQSLRERIVIVSTPRATVEANQLRSLVHQLLHESNTNMSRNRILVPRGTSSLHEEE